MSDVQSPQQQKPWTHPAFWLHLLAALLGAFAASGYLTAPGVPAPLVQGFGMLTTLLSAFGYTVHANDLHSDLLSFQLAGQQIAAGQVQSTASQPDPLEPSLVAPLPQAPLQTQQPK